MRGASAPPSLRTRLGASIIVAAAIAAYFNGFTNRFAGLDARESIRDNLHIRHLLPLSEAMSLPLLSATKTADEGSKGGTVVRRPVLSLSFALNHAVTGLRPNGFHAANIAIHIGAGLLLFGIVRRSLQRPPFAARFADSSDAIALATAVLWTIHPLQTESVTYIVQRAESLMGMFFLLTVYASLRGFESSAPGRWYALAVASSALGMGTKEVAAVAPAIVLLYDSMFVSAGPRDALRKRPVFYLALFSTWLVLGALMVLTLEDVSSDFTEGRNLSYALAQPAAIMHYLRVAVWPHPLHVYINTTLYEGLSWVRIAVPGAVVAAALGATLYGVVRRTWYGFVGAWFFLILAPSSSVVAVSDVVQEHRMYLSLAAVLLPIVIGTHVGLRHLDPQRGARFATAVCAVTALVLIVLTHRRNGDYHGEFSMIHPADLPEAYLILGNHYTLGGGDLDVGRKEADEALVTATPGQPDYTYAHYMLGLLADKSGDTASAVRHFEQAAESDPAFVRAAAKLGESLMASDDLARAREVYGVAITRAPAEPDLQLGLGRVLLASGDVAGARDCFARAVALEPNSAAAHNNLGFTLDRLGDGARAQVEYRFALTLDPGMVVARRNLADALAANGDLAAARQEYERVLADDPAETRARVGLADACTRQEDLDCAEAQLRQAQAQAPDDAQVSTSLGVVLETRGRNAEAQASYERALTLEPDHVGARNALGTLLARQGQFDEAESHFERVLARAPDNVDAHSNLGASYAAQGKAQAAAEHLRAVLRLAPARRAANFNLGLLLEERGELEKAEKHYQRELEIDPGFEPARLNLERVRAKLAQQ